MTQAAIEWDGTPIQSNIMGRKRKIELHDQDESHERRIRPDQDLYPVPLNPRSCSYVRVGIERLLAAIEYLQVARVRTLLLEYIRTNTLEEIYAYRTADLHQNILHFICDINVGPNLHYADNRELYHELLTTFTRLVPDLSRLDTSDYVGRTPLVNCIYHSRFLAALVLIHHGCTFNPANPKYSQTPSLLYSINATARTHRFVAMLSSDRMQRVMTSTLPPGLKLLSLAQECPLSKTSIITPVILEDGFVYDAHWLHKRSKEMERKSPMTRESISRSCYFLIDNIFSRLY